ncbi:MAG: outer membrane protein TolC [Bradymonadia bacterium]|jgi:outer membrane protein TolC
MTALLPMLLLLATPPLTTQPLAAPPNGPDAVVQLALTAHPEIDAMQAQVEALEAAVPQARVWADPMVGLQYSNMPLTRPYPGGHPMSGLQITVSQRLTGADKIDARVGQARAMAAAGVSGLDESRNRLGAAVAMAWHQLALTRALAGLTVAHQATVDQLSAVLQVRYATNTAAQFELVQLDLLTAQLIESKADLDAQASALTARINATLGRPPSASIATPDVAPPPPPPGLDAMIAALDAHPRLATLTARAKAEAAGVRRADAERRPDVTVLAGYRVRAAVDGGDPGEDFITIGASMPLPWLWNDERWGAQAQRHQAATRRIKAQEAALRRTLVAEISASHAELVRARARAAAHVETLIPTAHTVLTSTLTAYRVGRASFEALYRAQRRVLDLEQALRRAHTAAALAAVRMHAATGRYSKVGP